ncbi:MULTISPECIES: ABC transporter ATP-binding protein [Curtobacterium]|uniref:ABC transporter ATP-binding protein n=1 Tax=Curtobacterium TaxID=2034 RepID=UPI000E2D788E|nr:MULTISPECIES: ABC transporter ATP-binding protein [Curtobacterium]RDI02340.1 ABC-2 type transport system ATP-binding protein [Curtobacterium sp. AG1037]TQJ27265.1 ABC-2 type transport system ATP-binding protein [Curtobacterium citreum]
MAAADDDDVYVTSDAAWMTEVDDAEGDATDDDLGDGDARDASAGDGMTDDTTTTVSDPAVTEPATASTIAASTTAAGPSPASRPAPRKGKGRGRVSRPVQTAAVRDDAAARDAAIEQTTTSGQTAAPAKDTASEQSSAAPTAADDAGTTAAQKKKRVPKRQPAARETPAATKTPQQPVVLRASGLVKRYGQTLAADEVDLEIRQGSIFGVVGPNGAGKTTTLSMITGLLRPDAGTVSVLDHDVWSDPTAAKRDLGVLPDRLRLFDRLTGAQLLHYSATLRGLDGATARKRSADLAQAFGLGEALGRQVADYSVGMAKKIALAATLIHSPRVLVLDEPFESVDPVSAATITEILRRYTRGGGTVVLSSHSMELVQRTCDSVAIIVGGKVLASGTMAQVRGRRSLEDKFVELAGGRVVAESMEWLHSFSD